jgi:hypothetical protein
VKPCLKIKKEKGTIGMAQVRPRLKKKKEKGTIGTAQVVERKKQSAGVPEN